MAVRRAAGINNSIRNVRKCSKGCISFLVLQREGLIVLQGYRKAGNVRKRRGEYSEVCAAFACSVPALTGFLWQCFVADLYISIALLSRPGVLLWVFCGRWCVLVMVWCLGVC